MPIDLEKIAEAIADDMGDDWEDLPDVEDGASAGKQDYLNAARAAHESILQQIEDDIERETYIAWGCCSNEREASAYMKRVVARLRKEPKP